MANDRDFPLGRITSSLLHGRPQLQRFSALNLEVDTGDVGHDIRTIPTSGELLTATGSEPVSS